MNVIPGCRVAVKMAPLDVGQDCGGVPHQVNAVVKVSVTSGPVMAGRARLALVAVSVVALVGA